MANQLALVLTVDSTQGNKSLDGVNSKLSLIEQNAVRVSQRASAGFNSMEREALRLAASMRQQFAGIGDSIKNFIQNPLEASGVAMRGMLASLGPVGAGIAAGGVALSAMAVAGFKAAESLGNLGNEIRNTSIRTGLTTKEVGQFSFAARAAGGDITLFEGAMRKLSEGLVDGGVEGKKSAAALRDLGIRAFESDGKLRPMSDIFSQIGASLAAIEDPARRNAEAIRLLGRSGVEMVPVLVALNENLKIAKENNFGLDDATIRRFEKFDNTIATLQTKWSELAIKIKEPLAASVLVSFKFISDQTKFTTETLATMGNYLFGGVPPPNTGISRGGQRFELGESESLSAHRRQVEREKLGASSLSGFLKDGSLDSAQRQLGELKESYDKVRSAAEQLAQTGRVLPVVAEEQRVAINQARAAYEGQLSVVRSIETTERARAEQLAKFIGNIEKQTAIQEAATAKLFEGATTIAQRSPAFGPEIEAFDLASQGRAFGYVAALRSLKRPSGDISDLEAQQAAADAAHLRAIDRELNARERIIQLQAGPGGERAAAQQIYDLKIAAADKELKVLQVSKEYGPYKEKIEQASLDLQVQLVEIERRRFDTIKASAGQLLDSMLGGARSFADALRRIVLTAFFTPIKEAASTVIAEAFTGRKTSGGGLLSGIFGLGSQGLKVSGAPGGTSGFSGPVQKIETDYGTFSSPASQVAQLGIGGGAIAQGGLLAKLGFTGSTLGMLGVGGSAFGLQGAYKLGQTESLAGKVGAPVLGAVSGLLGFGSLAALFPALIAAGPAGWIAAAGIGATIGLIGAFKSSAEAKIVEKVRAVYGIDIPKSLAKDPLLGIIKQNFGGNISAGVSSPMVRDLIELYAMSTGQNVGGGLGAPRMTPQSFSDTRGSITQNPGYFNGAPLTTRPVATPATNINVQLDAKATNDFWSTQSLRVIAENPRAIAQSQQKATRQSIGRRESMASQFGMATA